MSTKVVTGKIRLSFCHLFEAQEPQGGGDPKYSVTLLIPKSDKATLQKITEAMKEARDKFCEKNGSTALPAKPSHTLHDGDGQKDNGEEYGPECKGHWVISVSSKQKPVVVDAAGNGQIAVCLNANPGNTDFRQIDAGDIEYHGTAKQGQVGVCFKGQGSIPGETIFFCFFQIGGVGVLFKAQIQLAVFENAKATVEAVDIFNIGGKLDADFAFPVSIQNHKKGG